MRAQLEDRGPPGPSAFREQLRSVPPRDRDAWLDLALGSEEVPADGAALPRGCTPYLPCSVGALLGVIDLARVEASDVFIDVGSGIGRAAAFVHLSTGACAVGIEVQPALAAVARALTARTRLSDVTFHVGDVLDRLTVLERGTVFLLYAPFGGERLRAALAAIEAVGRARAVRVCTVDVPSLDERWLLHAGSSDEGVSTYFSVSPMSE